MANHAPSGSIWVAWASRAWSRTPKYSEHGTWVVTTRIHCSDHFDQRDQALLAHATQIDPDGFWFSIPRELQVATWPTEDYELVTSHVDTSLPEDDLFAGIRGR